MNSTTKDKDGNLVISIQGELSAYEVGTLKNDILNGLKNHKGLILNIDAVTECDTLGIQLLFSAGKTALKQNKPFLITGRSEPCCKAALGIGLEPEEYLNALKEAQNGQGHHDSG